MRMDCFSRRPRTLEENLKKEEMKSERQMVRGAEGGGEHSIEVVIRTQIGGRRTRISIDQVGFGSPEANSHF